MIHETASAAATTTSKFLLLVRLPMESPAARRQRRASTSSISVSSGQQVSAISDFSKAASDGYPYPSYNSSSSDAASSYRRQPSSYSAPFPSQVSRSSTRRSGGGSFRAAARVAGVFGSCFVPRVRKDEAEEEDREASRGSRSGGFHVSTDSAGTGKESGVLTVADISRATSNFSEKNMIRQGASSSIYKAKLKDGSQVAVKRARKLNGPFLSAELTRELETLQKIEHQNLVRFIGFLEQRDETLIVVEYVDNGSLREHLDESRGTGLELAQRLNVAIDVAHAITYLHEYAERAVIHRDIRSSNVLLTSALAPKVAGFGLARVADDESDATHVTTLAMGTAGYVDPEYLGTLQLTDKSDVYSFGVLLVELVTGRPPIERRPGLEPRATTKWAMQKFRGGDAVVAMDPRMRRSPAAVAAVEGMLRLAEQCIAPARKDRPSMRRCTEALWTMRRDFHWRQEPRQDATAAAGDRSAEWVSR